MRTRFRLAAVALVPLAAVAAHRHWESPARAGPAVEAAFQPDGPGDGFERVSRPGSVDIEREYDLSRLAIPKEEIHTLLPRDAIPALVDPKTQPAGEAKWLDDDARIVQVVIGDEALGVPLRILDWHEVVNTSVGGEPIAVTYCPLCDSAAVFSRRVTPPADPRPADPGSGSGAAPSPSSGVGGVVLEFGVSGALYNSNVLMYDRKDMGLWSQLGMRAVSGPMAGTVLDALPVEVVSFADFRKAHPDAQVVSNDTGHTRDYSHSPYQSYFEHEGLMVPVAEMGDALPRKTLGVGIATGQGDDAQAWFVPVDAIGDGRTIATPAGDVRLSRSRAGVVVDDAPPEVRTAQTFYYSWSAFYPATKVVPPPEPGDEAAATTPREPGLAVGDQAPDALVTSVAGEPVRLASLYEDGPIVLTFYRGGWCPICNRTLSAWGPRLGDLKAAGGAFVALTPETPELAAATRDKAAADYVVYSDGAFEAAKAFKVHFVVDEATRVKYQQFGLKVVESNVSGTWELPAPATFVIDRDGVIRYAFADWDYTKRADPDEVIAAVRRVTEGR